MSEILSYINEYRAARRIGKKEYSAGIAKGESGYLPTLEGIIENTEIVSEVDIGLMEIPLKKIKGTYSHSRSLSFSRGFMPLLDEKSEFAMKWSQLYESQMKVGIRDPIKVYEYLNWYYVVEGNKRVSIMKYLKGFSIAGRVTRLIPKKDEQDPDIKIYYEYLEFYKKTRINLIWFSDTGSFDTLGKYLDSYKPTTGDDKYKHFLHYVYLPFREVFHEAGGGQLDMTTGDAFLEYINIYNLPEAINEGELRPIMREFIKELRPADKAESIDLSTAGNAISKISTIVSPGKKLRVAFVHANNAALSNWTFAHEQGRLQLESNLGEYLTTSCFNNVPENDDSYIHIKGLAEEGYDIVFTTSPVFAYATLRAAIEYPAVKFFNCSGMRAYKHMSTYFGRMYEPRFLTGIIAGTMTKSNTIGYAASYPIPEVIGGINAFALGAKFVNPYSRVRVEWINAWYNPGHAAESTMKLIQSGADVISHHQNSPAPQQIAEEYGVYFLGHISDLQREGSKYYLACTRWNWGIFYEKLLRNILSGTWKVIFDMISGAPKLENFWWGMNAGVVDISEQSELVPRDTKKLVAMMRKLIMQNEYNPFTGPVFDSKGVLRISDNETAEDEAILTMDWLADNIDGEIPVEIDPRLPQDRLIKLILEKEQI